MKDDYDYRVHSLKPLCNFVQKDSLGRRRFCYEDRSHSGEHRDRIGRKINLPKKASSG